VTTKAESVDGDASTLIEPPPQQYVGLITRGIGFAIDVAIIDLVALIVAAGGALIITIFHFPHDLKTAMEVIGVVAYILWSIGYFVGFWSTTGQTPGGRMMQCRVITTDGGRIGMKRAFVRCVGLVLAALPLFAGYLLSPFDRRRRGLQDRLARTVVIEAIVPSAAEQRRLERLAARAARRERSSDPGEDGDVALRQSGARPWRAMRAAAPAQTVSRANANN
jgi:uncharacterized RDD family membrane protein YckC